MVEGAVEEARAFDRSTNSIWTDGSSLVSQGMGGAVAWYEEVQEEPARLRLHRRGVVGLGTRRVGTFRTYRGRNRSGWRSVGFGMSIGHEAHDAELTAITYGLLLLSRRRERGQDFTLFTDSQAAMRRMANDAPGPGQEIVVEAIGPA